MQLKVLSNVKIIVIQESNGGNTVEPNLGVIGETKVVLVGLDVYLITPITLGKRTLGVGGRLKRNDVGENTTTGRVVGQILLVIRLRSTCRHEQKLPRLSLKSSSKATEKQQTKESMLTIHQSHQAQYTNHMLA